MKVLLICVCLILFAACSAAPEMSFADLPSGDAGRGAALFAEGAGGAPACATCHTLDGTTLAGPSLQNYASIAPVADAGAPSLEDYTYTSIVQPSAHVVTGFGNTMYNQYERQLSPQQVADLIAYLLTL